MANLINRTERGIKIGQYFLIPGKPTEIKELNELKKLYPDLAAMLDKGDVLSVNKAEAQKAEADFEAKSLERLKAKAKEKGINTAGMTKTQIDEALSSAGE